MGLLVSFLVLLFFSLSGLAQPGLVDLESFQVGQSWTWSYAEQTVAGDSWPEPYLYETYRVVERNGDWVTIEISSTDDLEFMSEPHHRMIVNLDDCRNSVHSLGRLFRWKIQFYTTTRSEGWSLVSRKHKNLAFTEKFNCYQGPISYKSKEKVVMGDLRSIEGWLTIPIHSFYISDDSVYQGIAALRRSRNYQMRLHNVFFRKKSVK